MEWGEVKKKSSQYLRWVIGRFTNATKIVRNLTTWLLGIFIAALAAFLTASFSGIFQTLIPSPEEIICSVGRYFEPAASNSDYAVIIASFENDPNNEFRNALVSKIRERTGLPVMTTCQTITIDTSGDRDEAGEIAEEYGTKILKNRNANIMLWGEKRPQEDGFRIWFSHPYEDNTVGHSGELVKIDAIEKFIDDKFAWELFTGADFYAIPNTHETVAELEIAAEKIGSLYYARGPQYWEVRSSYDNAKLLALRAHLLSVIYQNSPSPNSQYLKNAIELLESAFRLTDYNPLSPPPFGTDISLWRVYYQSTLKLYAKSTKSLKHAKRAVAVANAELREELEHPSITNSAWMDYENLGEAHGVLFSITGSDTDKEKAIENLLASVSLLIKAGVGYGGNPPADPTLRRWFEDDPSSIEPIEKYDAYVLLLELGFTSEEIFKVANNNLLDDVDLTKKSIRPPSSAGDL